MDGDIRNNVYDDGSVDVLTDEQRIRNFSINFGPQHPAAHGGHLQSLLGAGGIHMGHRPGDAAGMIMHGAPHGR